MAEAHSFIRLWRTGASRPSTWRRHAVVTLGYAMVFAAATAAWLVILLPYEAIQARLLAEAGEASGLTIIADSWRVAWPPSLEWRGVTVTSPGCCQADLEHLRLTLSSGGPAGGWATLREGLLTLASRGRWSSDGHISMIGTAPGHPPILQGRIDGTWSLDAEHDTISHVSVTLSHGTLARTPAVRFATMSANADCVHTTCRIVSLTGDGPDLGLIGDGTLTMAQPITESHLTLNLIATPAAGVADLRIGALPLAPAEPTRVRLAGKPGAWVIVAAEGAPGGGAR